jgi:paraquat-inducible protein B
VSAKVSATAIGVFVVGMVLLVMGALVFFGGLGFFGDRDSREQAVVVFTGSVKGLNVGAPVTLRGVKIGEVMDIDIRPDPRSREFVIPVSVSINARDLGKRTDDQRMSVLQPLIERGLRAQLKTQSLLTGLLYIDFDFRPGSEARYVEYESEVPQIPTAPTELEAILQRVSDIDIQAFLQHANETLQAANALLSNPETQKIPANLNLTLADMRRLLRDMDREVGELGNRLTALAITTGAAVDGVRGDIALLNQRVDVTLGNLDATLASVQRASDGAAYTFSDDSPVVYELQRSIVELRRAARALQALADGVEREPESLLRGKRIEKEER